MSITDGEISDSPGILKKIIFVCVIALIAVLAFLYSASVLKKELSYLKPVPGFSIFLEKKDIYSVALSAGTIWAGGSNGLYRMDAVPGKDAEYAIQTIGKYKYVRAILVQDEKIWIGHDNGLTLIQGEMVKNFTEAEGLPDIRVNTLCLDSEEGLWVGTWGGAVFLKGNKIIKTLKMKDGLIDDMVNVIMEDSYGGMWFGSYVAPRGGVSVLYDGKWQRFSANDALLHANINAIIQLHSKDVIAGGGLYTKGGAARFTFRGGIWVKESVLEKKDGLAGAKIRSLLEDSKGRLWVGSEYEGLAVLFNGKSEILTKKTGLSNDEVKVIKEEKDGTIWIGTREGLVRIDKGKIPEN